VDAGTAVFIGVTPERDIPRRLVDVVVAELPLLRGVVQH
jgi:hypothetical protein